MVHRFGNTVQSLTILIHKKSMHVAIISHQFFLVIANLRPCILAGHNRVKAARSPSESPIVCAGHIVDELADFTSTRLAPSHCVFVTLFHGVDV